MDFLNDDFVQKILQSVENSKCIIINKNLQNNVIKAGNNFLSDIKRLIIEYDKDGKIVTKYFILKIFSTVSTYKFGQEMGIYDRELNIYHNILPKMAKLMKNNELVFPVAYDCIYPEMLVLEDLEFSGYKMMNKNEQFDYQHSAIVFKTLARFHGTSIAMTETHSEVLLGISQGILYNDSRKELWMRFINPAYDSFIQTMSEIESIKKYTSHFIELREWIYDQSRKITNSEIGELNVLAHGDCWMNNIMFKHDDENNVISCKLLDFQVTRIASLATDILTFAITSMKFDVFIDHFEELLQIYVNTLNETLNETSINENMKYTLDNVKREIDDQITSYGILVVISILPVILADRTKPTDMEEINDVGTSNNTKTTIYEKANTQTKYRELLTKWILYIYEKYLKTTDS